MNAELEDHRILFCDAAHAVRWAEERATRNGLGSQLGGLMKPGGGEFSNDELYDAAGLS